MKKEMLEKKWKSETWFNLFDNFIGYSYQNGVAVPNFKDNASYQLSENFVVEIEFENIPDIEYMKSSDFYNLISDLYDNNHIRKHYEKIWKTKTFQNLREYIIKEWIEILTYFNQTLQIFLNSEDYENFATSEIIELLKDNINIYVDSKYRG